MSQALAAAPKPGEEIVGTATLPLPITQSFVNDVLTTAFEGGMNYWAYEADLVAGEHPSDPLSEYRYAPKDFSWELRNSETGEWYKDEKEDFPKYRPLTLASFIEGFQLYVAHFKGNPYGDCMDPGNYDVEQADMVVQYAVFGEVIFG